MLADGGAYIDDGFADGDDGVHDCHEAAGNRGEKAFELFARSARCVVLTKSGIRTQETTAPILTDVLWYFRKVGLWN